MRDIGGLLGNVGESNSDHPGEQLAHAASQGHLSVVKEVLEMHPEKVMGTNDCLMLIVKSDIAENVNCIL